MKAYQLVPDFQLKRTVPCRLTSPDGEAFVVLGLQAFAILFDLKPASLKAAAKSGGKTGGWAVERLPADAITETASLWTHPELAQRMKAAKAADKFRRPGHD